MKSIVIRMQIKLHILKTQELFIEGENNVIVLEGCCSGGAAPTPTPSSPMPTPTLSGEAHRRGGVAASDMLL